MFDSSSTNIREGLLSYLIQLLKLHCAFVTECSHGLHNTFFMRKHDCPPHPIIVMMLGGCIGCFWYGTLWWLFIFSPHCIWFDKAPFAYSVKDEHFSINCTYNSSLCLSLCFSICFCNMPFYILQVHCICICMWYLD